jgi:16S rRNA (guanine527-N7)-methyltransferase
LELIKKYFNELTPEQEIRLGKLDQLYHDWNERINVISRKDIGELYLRHVLHSLAIAKFIQFENGTKVLDVGCGGGFPGVPLAIMFPGVHFTLSDSIGKKIKVVTEVANELGLKNVAAVNQRAERLDERFDFITSRAVTAFPKFVALTRKLLANKQINRIPNGIIYLKGGDFDNEISPFRSTIEITPLAEYFDEPFFETKKIIYLPV